MSLYDFPAYPVSELASNGYVAPHPVTARDWIKDFYSCSLSLSGNSCSGISALRDTIESIDTKSLYSRCFLITAPHTHWGSETIVESFDSERKVYVAGPTNKTTGLWPFSFVFTREGLVPYEWADDTVPIDPAELEDAYEGVTKVGNIVQSSASINLPIPLGISIGHRFKNSIWEPQLFTPAEGPHNEEDGRAVIRPVLESVVRENPDNCNQVQIAWSAYPTREVVEPPFSESEAKVLADFEEMLRGLDVATALKAVKAIDSGLAREV